MKKDMLFVPRSKDIHFALNCGPGYPYLELGTFDPHRSITQKKATLLRFGSLSVILGSDTDRLYDQYRRKLSIYRFEYKKANLNGMTPPLQHPPLPSHVDSPAMHYTTSPHSWIDAKAYRDSISLSPQTTVSSAWTNESHDPSLYPGQNAPRFTPVPLPSGSNSNTPALNPVLVYDPEGRLRFNLLQPFTNLRFRPCYPTTVMNESALNPRSQRVLINIPGIPVWVIDVVNPLGVTVYDVLVKIYSFFHASVEKEEYITFPPQVQSHSAAAFNQRTAQDPIGRAQGMKRLDLISPNFFMVGLTRATDGSDRWTVRLTPSVHD